MRSTRSDNQGMPEPITRDPEVMRGTPVFGGTRVPVKTMFEYLEAGESLDDFLGGFPTVSREVAVQVLEESRELRPGLSVVKILIDECVDQRLRFLFSGHDCETAVYANLSGLKNVRCWLRRKQQILKSSSPRIRRFHISRICLFGRSRS